MWNFFQTKDKPNKDFDLELSRLWRECYTPSLFKTLERELVLASIEEMYSLLFFLANDEYLSDCITCILKKDYKELCLMNRYVPIDFDNLFYPMYDLVYIIANDKNYLAIILDENFDSKKSIKLDYFIEVEPFDVSRFIGRRLIYSKLLR